MMSVHKRASNKYERIIALIDMDCFYCQVEEQLNPNLKGKPIIVQPLQYDDYGGGGIIALNYVAKARGVKRSMRGDEAKKQCPDLELVKVPVVRGKADLSKYRNAGKQVASVLQTFSPLMTRASVDEAYLDITEQVQKRLFHMNKGLYSLRPSALENTFAVGYDSIAKFVQFVTNKARGIEENENDLEDLSEEDREVFRKKDMKMLIALSVVNEIRAKVKEQTGYECSAGIAHNKILAKLVCGINKPNKQTLLPLRQIPEFFRTLPIRKVQGLGGKFGEKVCEELRVQCMSELLHFSKEELQRRFDAKNGSWLYDLARGIDLEPVTPRLAPKTINCGKMFPRQNALTELTALNHWLHEIARDVVERVQQDEMDYNRRPKQIVVSFTQSVNNNEVSHSRAVTFAAVNEEKIVNDAVDVIRRNTAKFLKPSDPNSLSHPITFLGLNVGKFENLDKRNKSFVDMFCQSGKKSPEDSKAPDETVRERNSDISSTDDNSEQGTTKDEYDILFEAIQDQPPSSPQPTTSSKSDIRQTNTESYKQPAPTELSKVECTLCGENVSSSEIQIHEDAHLAFQLNEELKAERQNPPTDSAIPSKSKKQKVVADEERKCNSIQKFLIKVQPEETITESSTGTQVDGKTEKCSECGKNVAVVNFLEHMDFHAAQKLHMQLMKADAKDNRDDRNPAHAKKEKKSIRPKGKSSKKDAKRPATRNIASFFKKMD